MAEIKVKFIHPVDGGSTEVELDSGTTASEAISNLIEAGIISANPYGYSLAKKGSNNLDPGKTFAEGGIVDGDLVRIIPATDAGR